MGGTEIRLSPLFYETFQGMVVVSIVLAGFVQIRFSDSRMAIDALLGFLLGIFGRSHGEGRKEKRNSSEYCQCPCDFDHLALLTCWKFQQVDIAPSMLRYRTNATQFY